MGIVQMKKGLTDAGIIVQYEEQKSKVVFPGGMKEYRTGEMICEVTKSNIKDRIEQVTHCPLDKEKISFDSADETIDWIFANPEVDPEEPVLTTFITDFMRNFIFIADFENYSPGAVSRELHKLMLKSDASQRVASSVFGKSFAGKFKVETIHDALLCGYYTFLITREWLKDAFDKALKGNPIMDGFNLEGVNLSTVGVNESDTTIPFQILNRDGQFLQVYRIPNLLSLLIFEMVHIQEQKIKVARCKNCGSFFIPRNRSDTLYCDNPSPQDPNRTCKKVGAQITRISMEKQNVAIQKYRKIYLVNNMRMRRHPENDEYKKIHEKMLQGSKAWRRKLKDNPELYPEFEKWVDGLNSLGSKN